MLTFDPTKRITGKYHFPKSKSTVRVRAKTCLLIAVEEALEHPYLERLHDVEDEPICPNPFSFDFEQQVLGEQQIKELIYQEALAHNPEYA